MFPGLPGIFDQQRFFLPVIAKENVNVEIIELHTYSRRNWRPGTRRCCKTARHTIPAGGSGLYQRFCIVFRYMAAPAKWHSRSEEHTSELQSLMRISYAVFCLKKKQKNKKHVKL